MGAARALPDHKKAVITSAMSNLIHASQPKDRG
jgi:hypothetical protein